MLLFGDRAEEGRACLLTAMAHIRTGTDPTCEAVVTAHLATACRELQRNEETISYSERSIVLYQANKNPGNGALCLTWAIFTFRPGGSRKAPARWHVRWSGWMPPATRRRWGGSCWRMAGQTDRARSCLASALALATRLQIPESAQIQASLAALEPS
jgi:hypothetical protein